MSNQPDSLTQAIYQHFSPAPVSTAEAPTIYVPLDAARGNTHVVTRLARKIRLTAKWSCQVLAGHKGSGKSTELNRLQQELESPKDPADKKFFTVFVKTDDDTDRNDVDFPDLLIAIVRQLAAQLKSREAITLTPGYFKSRLDELKKLAMSEVSFDGIDIDTGFGKIATSLKASPTARDAIRKAMEPDTGNWLAAANDVIGKATLELVKLGYAGLVILVDDLDKMVVRPHPQASCSTAEHLFVNRAGQLTAFQCHLVYTIPLSLAYSSPEATIRANFGGEFPVVPMTKIATKPPHSKPYEAGIELFRKIIANRLAAAGATEAQAFHDADTRDELIQLSGGQPTELMTLVRQALITDGLPIKAAALHLAKNETQRAYARQFRAEHWPIIEDVRATGIHVPTTATEPYFRELLDSRAVLQYVNDEEWYALNPMVAALTPPIAGKKA